MAIAEQLNDIIDVLSERLGVAGDYVYQALMNQVTVEIFDRIITLAFIVVMIALAALYCKKVFWDKNKNGDTIFDRADQSDSIALVLMLTGVGLILGIIVFVCVLKIPSLLSGLVQMITNPEYYALQQIMEMI